VNILFSKPKSADQRGAIRHVEGAPSVLRSRSWAYKGKRTRIKTYGRPPEALVNRDNQ